MWVCNQFFGGDYEVSIFQIVFYQQIGGNYFIRKSYSNTHFWALFKKSMDSTKLINNEYSKYKKSPKVCFNFGA
jgi:hypothetical protein